MTIAPHRCSRSCVGNPLSSRQAWTGERGGYQHVRIALHVPTAGNGRNAQLRWRVGTDELSFCGPNTCLGYTLDNIAVASGTNSDSIFTNGFDPPQP